MWWVLYPTPQTLYPICMIVGIDEVGRGCLAGPVVAGAVLLVSPIKGLRDSKMLSRSRREQLALIIEKQALALGLGWADAHEVDEYGLTHAVRLAMQRALEQIKHTYKQIIIDGNYNFLATNPLATTIIKADSKVAAVSAASIIAKVARDNFMRQQALLYPNYGFDKHVGYGTRMHLNALTKLGACELHRKSFKPVSLNLSLL